MFFKANDGIRLELVKKKSIQNTRKKIKVDKLYATCICRKKHRTAQ